MRREPGFRALVSFLPRGVGGRALGGPECPQFGPHAEVDFANLCKEKSLRPALGSPLVLATFAKRGDTRRSTAAVATPWPQYCSIMAPHTGVVPYDPKWT